MSSSIEPELPVSMWRVLDGSQPEAFVGETFELVTVDEDQWPRLALLSVGELLAVSRATLRLALWQHTSSNQNLRRSRLGLLAYFTVDAAYYVRIRSRFLGVLDVPSGPLDAFEAQITGISADAVGYARITSGIRFSLTDEVTSVERWQQTRRALRSMASDELPAVPTESG